jgi:hypothetical protein
LGTSVSTAADRLRLSHEPADCARHGQRSR